MTGERRLVPTESYSKQGMVTKNYEVKGSTARQPIGEKGVQEHQKLNTDTRVVHGPTQFFVFNISFFHKF